MSDRKGPRAVLGTGSWVLVVAVACLVACQSTSRVGDRYYKNGRFPEAAAAYEVFLGSEPAKGEVVARTLYRMGLVLAVPGSTAYDPQRSLAVFERLIEEYPESYYSVDARILLDLQQRIEQLENDSIRLHQSLTAAETEVTEYRERLRSLEQQLESRDEEILALQESIPPLQEEIRSLLRQLAAKERELEKLEQLKAIDLAEPPL